MNWKRIMGRTMILGPFCIFGVGVIIYGILYIWDLNDYLEFIAWIAGIVYISVALYWWNK